MELSKTADLWWKTAVFYCADVQTFLDADGDGQGDLVGMTRRVDYLADLGITCLWLMPLYPTRDVDDGYDITDFLSVDPRLGDLGDFVELVRTARSRGSAGTPSDGSVRAQVRRDGHRPVSPPVTGDLATTPTWSGDESEGT